MLVKVAIVEDDSQIGEALQAVVEASPELFFKGLFNSAESFSVGFKHLDVDVVLMDIQLPGITGIECVENLKEKRPEVQFMMCTNFEDSESLFSALSVGATGYIIKSSSSRNIIDAIKEIHAGGSPMSPSIARKVAEAFKVKKKNKDLINVLSPRELQILELLALGYPYKLIAKEIERSIETIRTNIRDIYMKLHVHNKTEAINKLYQK